MITDIGEQDYPTAHMCGAVGLCRDQDGGYRKRPSLAPLTEKASVVAATRVVAAFQS